MLKKLFSFIVFTFLILSLQAQNVKVTISKIRTTKGMVHLAVYNNSNQFPYKPYKAFKLNKATLKDGKITFAINLEPGEYAFSFLDDEDSNGNMNYRLGIPKEGYGFSNNASPNMMGPPDYKDCLIKVTAENHFYITAKYIL